MQIVFLIFGIILTIIIILMFIDFSTIKYEIRELRWKWRYWYWWRIKGCHYFKTCVRCLVPCIGRNSLCKACREEIKF